MNPRIRIGKAIGETLKIYGVSDIEKKVRAMIKEVGLPEDTYYRYPHEFSGGQRQRICIARALVGRPKFVVCDEPISSLDVSIQSQIINLLKDLKKALNLTYLFISHDLRVVKNICDNISVMYFGNIVEEGTTEEIFAMPLHPYTRLLIASVPSMGAGKKEKYFNRPIDNKTANAGGCAFYTRCPNRQDKCAGEIPELVDRGKGHRVACHLNY